MQERLEAFGGNGTPLVFAHANGYPPGSYRQFLEPLQQYVQVIAYRHRPLWSDREPRRRLRWSHFADDLIHTLEAGFDEPVWMMGHSMGGAVSMLAAARRPQLFRGLILLDPVFMSSRKVLKTRIVPRERLPMVRSALRRPNHFGDHQEAFDFHRGKRPYSAVNDEVLWDYVHAGMVPAEGGGLKLAFSREWEAGVYASVPWIWPSVSRVRLPTLGLHGETSDLLTPATLRRWQRLQPQAELRACPGGHLLPMEHPQATAGFVSDFIRRQQDQGFNS